MGNATGELAEKNPPDLTQFFQEWLHREWKEARGKTHENQTENEAAGCDLAKGFQIRVICGIDEFSAQDKHCGCAG